jgi:hypothetical protein
MSEPADALLLSAKKRFDYITFLGWLAGKLESDPEGWADAAAAELRHIVTTNLTGSE